jgi:acyl carrier protein
MLIEGHLATFTADEIRDWLANEVRFDVARLKNDTPLFSNGTLDSFTMVELVALIEEKTGLVMPALDVTPENIDTIDRIVAWVHAQDAGPT